MALLDTEAKMLASKLGKPLRHVLPRGTRSSRARRSLALCPQGVTFCSPGADTGILSSSTKNSVATELRQISSLKIKRV